MTTEIKLTDTQREVLNVAAYRIDGNIEPLPPNLRGGARVKVIDGLLARGMVQIVQKAKETCYCLTDAAYAALGRARPAPAPIHPDPEVETAVAASEATWAQDKQDAAKRLIKTGVEGKPRSRENSKQAAVIEMLKRPSGATINEICEATGWQAHTVRGTFAGAFKKKLGLNITSFKDTGASRVYRIL